MRALILVPAFLSLLLLGHIVPLVTAQNIPIKYELKIDCPQRRIFVDINDVVCPVRAWDEQDTMGAPSVAVNPRDNNQIIMASLHGLQVGEQSGPSEWSRPSFTTFTSRDHGGSWTDNPYSGPQQYNSAYHEHPQIVVDAYGRAYIGSLYAQEDRSSNGALTWVLAAQKFDNLGRVDALQNGATNAQFIDTIHEGNQISQYWFLWDPDSENMTIVWHEKPYAPRARSSPIETLGTQELAATKGHDPGEHIAKVMDNTPIARAERQEQNASSTLPKSLISVAWTTPHVKSPYFYTYDENLIGPCVESTNPVLSFGYIYVGCVADPASGPFAWNPKVVQGSIELFRFKPNGGDVDYLGSSPIVGGHPKLGVRSDGRLAVFSTDAKDGQALLVGAYGHYRESKDKIEWSPLIDYGSKIFKKVPDIGVISTNIQDLEYRELSGAVHLIVKERVQRLGAVNVDNPANVALPMWRKTLFAFDENYGFLAKYNLDIGNMKNRTDPGHHGNPESFFNDLSDDLVQLPPKPFKYGDKDLGDNYQREFFAVGDYGYVIFAEVIELTDLRAPGVAPAGAPPAPLATAAASFNATTVFMWAGGLSLTSLFTLAMIANRRKNPLTAVTKGEK